MGEQKGLLCAYFDSDWRPHRSPDSREWSKYWWYKFTWIGELIRESTKQTNKRIAEQREAARRTALAKGEVGIRERKRVPILKDFAEQDFLSFVRSTFAAKPKTLAYYENGTNRLLAFEQLATERLGAISTDRVGEARSEAGYRLLFWDRSRLIPRTAIPDFIPAGTAFARVVSANTTFPLLVGPAIHE